MFGSHCVFLNLSDEQWLQIVTAVEKWDNKEYHGNASCVRLYCLG